MMPLAFVLALLLALTCGSLVTPDQAHSSCGGSHPSTGPSTPAPAPAQPSPPKPVPPGPAKARTTPPPAVQPKKPFSPAVPANTALIRAQMIAQITQKYAQMKNLIINKYLKERAALVRDINALIKNVKFFHDHKQDNAYFELANQYSEKMRALDAAHKIALADLDQRKSQEIAGVYSAK